MVYNQKDKIAYFHIWNTFYSETLPSDVIILDIVKRLDIKKLIIDCSTEYSLNNDDNFNPIKELNLYVANKNIEASLIIGAFPQDSTLENLSNFKIISYPLFWLEETYNNLHSNNLIESINFHQKQHSSLFFSHNRRARDHRCLLVDYLAKHNLLKDGGISWNDISLGRNNNHNFNFLYWKEEILTDINDQAQDPKHDNWYYKQFLKPGEKYINSLFDLVSETTTDTIFYTEKTWKPILYGKPFIIWGARDINKKLKDYGFDIFDDIIDHSFDSIKDDKERVEALCLELKRLSKLDYNNVYLKNRVIANKTQALKIIKEQNITYIPPKEELFPIVQM